MWTHEFWEGVLMTLEAVLAGIGLVATVNFIVRRMGGSDE